jgi:hypothetical protein
MKKFMPSISNLFERCRRAMPLRENPFYGFGGSPAQAPAFQRATAALALDRSR